jgi:hypothetical protein
MALELAAISAAAMSSRPRVANAANVASSAPARPVADDHQHDTAAPV